MNFIFSCWKYLSRVSKANEWEILSAREDKIRIPKRPCNILYLCGTLSLAYVIFLHCSVVHVILFSCYWILTSCAKILFHSQTELKPQETILVTVSKHSLPALSSIATKRACSCRARPTDILVKISPNLCFDLVVHFQSTMKK